jgi:hypothetical protein
MSLNSRPRHIVRRIGPPRHAASTNVRVPLGDLRAPRSPHTGGAASVPVSCERLWVSWLLQWPWSGPALTVTHQLVPGLLGRLRLRLDLFPRLQCFCHVSKHRLFRPISIAIATWSRVADGFDNTVETSSHFVDALSRSPVHPVSTKANSTAMILI